jgi:pilus assembly protein Flp/PilA
MLSLGFRDAQGTKTTLHTGRNAMLTAITTFIRDEEGATAVEYGLMAALIAAVIIAAVTAVGTSLSELFDGIATSLDTAAGS